MEVCEALEAVFDMEGVPPTRCSNNINRAHRFVLVSYVILPALHTPTWRLGFTKVLLSVSRDIFENTLDFVPPINGNDLSARLKT